MNRRLEDDTTKEPRVSLTAVEIEIVDAAIRGNRIKKALDARKLTQEEAARRVGISYRHFNRIVLNRSEPSMLVGLKLQEVLGHPIDKLFDISIRTRKARAQ